MSVQTKIPMYALQHFIYPKKTEKEVNMAFPLAHVTKEY
jgi:hypothetical protein